ncbi:Serine/threonine-protein kinase pim-3 [Dirofilaria immitis]|nr:Serine/threonine-protein kinase pim-3 [Dirofilaria immitis]
MIYNYGAYREESKKLATLKLYNLKLLLNGTLQLVSYNNESRGLSNFKKRYKLKGELGHGGFGVVYRGIRISDELPVAIKFIDRNHLEDERLPMEICMLARCIHVPGVIKLLDWYNIPEGFLIVMTRPYPCVDLFDFIKSHKKLDEDLARFLFRQIVLTIHDCVQQKVLHRDLKDENIVIDLVNGETSLVDFGAATLLKKNHYTDFQGIFLDGLENFTSARHVHSQNKFCIIERSLGTRLYCPPEWFLHSMYLGCEATVWSLGVLLYNMLNGRLPFRDEKEICTSHLLGSLPFYTQVSKNAMDLIAQCLCFDPNKRCTLDAILKHSWMRIPCADWSTLIDRTYQNSSDDQQDNVIYANHISKEHTESSYAESGVGSTSSFSPSTSSSFRARYRLGEQRAGGIIVASLSRRNHAYHCWDENRACQSKISVIDDSLSLINTREFMKMDPISYFVALKLEKRSTDSGQQSALFSVALLPKPSSHESFNGRTGRVLGRKQTEQLQKMEKIIITL